MNRPSPPAAPAGEGAAPMSRLDPAAVKSLFELNRRGDFKTLEEQTRALLARHPEELVLLSLLGSACLELGQWEEALKHCQAGLAIKPDFAKLRNSAGVACLRLGRLQEAADNFHRAVNMAPELAEAWFNLGIVHERLQRWEDAASCHEKAALAAPTYCKAWEARARMAWELGQFQQVVPLYERALALKEDHLPAHRGLLQFLGQSNRPEALAEALARARRALGEEHALVRLHEGFMADAEGKLEQARACLEGIVIDDAGDGASAEEDAGSLHDERLRLARLVRLCDQLDDADAAMEHARSANRLAQKMTRRRGVRKETFLGFVENRRRYFTPENVRQWGPTETRDAAPARPEGSEPDGAKQPVFIIGFPRSGTTLLDSLLRGHPDLEVFEETDAVSSLVNRLAGPADEGLSRLARLSEQEAAALRALYFEGLARRRAAQNATERGRPGATTVDRFALNIIYLGELCRVFPQARFILALRHPADCVLSCFMQTFYETSANASFHTLEDAARLYDSVFSLWRQQMEALKPKLIQVKYESLIHDPEKTCRPVLDFIGATWRPELLDHQRAARERAFISTPSHNQVILPLYSQAKGRWRRYRKELAPVLPTLDPWRRYFGYD